MATGTRFYLLAYKGHAERNVLLEDLGNTLKVSGVVLEGMGTRVIALLPSADASDDVSTIVRPDAELWGEMLRLSDDPKVLINGTVEKALHRKLRFEISGAVQQKVWVRDECRCMYCNRPMGVVQLTIDHFVPLELGGANDESNYLTACKNCNKSKGSIHPQDWCEANKLNYNFFADYLRTVKIK